MGATSGPGRGGGASTTCVHPASTKANDTTSPRFPMAVSVGTLDRTGQRRGDASAVTGRQRSGCLFEAPLRDRMLDAVGQLRARPAATAVATRGADLGKRCATLCGLGIPLHGSVFGTELLDRDRHVAVPAVDEHPAGREIAFAVAS